MKIIFFFFLSFYLGEVVAQSGLLTEAQLQEAVDKNQCSTLASRLDSLEFSSERMKLNAAICMYRNGEDQKALSIFMSLQENQGQFWSCLLYTSPSPRDRTRSRMPSSA